MSTPLVTTTFCFCCPDCNSKTTVAAGAVQITCSHKPCAHMFAINPAADGGFSIDRWTADAPVPPTKRRRNKKGQ